MLMLKSLLAWLIILVLAIANGAVREGVLIPALGKHSGLALSGILLSALVMLVAYIFVRFRKGIAASQGLFIGIFWFCLTLAFEFTFGRLIQHKSWGELLEAYTFKDGNLWSVVLVVTLLAPLGASWLYKKSRHARNIA